MELVNRIPLSAFAFRQFDRNGDLDCVVSVRGAFTHVQDKPLALLRDQEPFQWTDAYDGNPHAGPLLRQTDLTPEKLGTDITFLGEAHAPDSKPARSWTCSLRVGDKVKELRVHGPRWWRPQFRDGWAGFSARQPRRILTGWILTGAEPVLSVPIDWRSAYGGVIPGAGNESEGVPADVEPANPLGCGIVDPACTDEDAAIVAPAITAIADVGLDWETRYPPEGFGLIPPWWRPRQQYTGTYDDEWLEKRHPLLPEDFDPRFWQCAHPDLIATPWLRGDEGYELLNLHRDWRRARGNLPDVTLGVRCEQEGRDEWIVLNLDGVQFDWRSGDERVLLTWRGRFPLPDAGDARLTLNRIVFADARPQREAAA